MKDLDLQQALNLLDICPTPMLLLHGDGNLRACNRSFAALAGLDGDDIASGQAPRELIAPLLAADSVIQWITTDGDERWLSVETAELDGMTGGIARFYLDITEQLRLRRACDALASELSEQTVQDEHLPSLLSRKGVLVSLEPLVARSRRYNSPLSVVTLSISMENDSGRDETLRQTVALLKDQTRWADLIGRNRSRDFILVLQETTQDAAMQLVEKLDEQLQKIISTTGNPMRVCYGITQCQKNDNATELLERAEGALEEARINDTGRSIAV